MTDLRRHPALKRKAISFVGDFHALYIDEVRITLVTGRTHTLVMEESKFIPAVIVSKVNK